MSWCYRNILLLAANMAPLFTWLRVSIDRATISSNISSETSILKCPIGCLWWYKCDQILNIIIVFSDIKPVSAILPFASKLIKKLFISECLSFPRLSTWWYYLPSLIEYENNVAFALGCTFNNYFFNLQIKMKNEDG